MTTRNHSRRMFLVMAIVATGACRRSSPEFRSTKEMVFLTREGCANTAIMRGRLDAALRAMGLPEDYRFVDIATLPATDRRGGYPTPTLLYRNRDVFGMPEPPLPHPEPT